MKYAADMNGNTPFSVISDYMSGDLPDTDVEIVTSGGLRIPVHRSILASASPVLESTVDRPRKHPRTIPILGVPCEAVAVFLRFLYAAKCSEEDLDKYGIHLLALSHVFLLARLCDTPDLHLKCMKLVSSNFKYVEKTEGWKFLQDHDPWLELQILQFIAETESRKKRRKRHREEQSLYLQLSEAMECLEHLCTEGCTSVGPSDVEPTKNKGPCSRFATCQGLQLLIRHFATCKMRVNGGCGRCKRMWQLFQLHSSICDQPDLCRVPLCRQFKLKAQQEKKGTDDGRWRLLVRKVVSAKAISSLSLPKRKREEDQEAGEMADHHGTRSLIRL
ncbi:BTB and TAZ domain protein 1 [Actinidia rufa]|uniref:BTB and TAZ domain protein 1 n=1 Tax=Actinidia rufa TaxID=165716 RepID=A0A7J0GMB6_9ERIC|nr:BTB and TAZ domain protein 1 [Actinidia rufa]